MKNILFILLLAACSAESVPEPIIEPDCNCGEVYDILVMFNPNTGTKYYLYELHNVCSGNSFILESYLDYNKKDEVCLTFEW